MRIPQDAPKTPAPVTNGPIQAKAPPTLQLEANPLQLEKEPKSIKACPHIDPWTDEQLQEEIDLLQQWIQDNSTHAQVHYYITLITRYRDTLRERKGEKQNPEEVTRKDYDKMYSQNNERYTDGDGKKKWREKSIGIRKKNINKLTSPTGHQAGEGGWLESDKDNNALFDAYFSSALPSGIAADDLKVLSSDFTTHNPGYKELPPPDLWPEMKKSLELIKKIQGVTGMTYKVASAYRSFRVNSHAGGAKGSAHMKFLGLDLNPQGDKSENEALLKFFYLTAGKKENMGLGFYNTGRQHIDASSYRNWKWSGTKSKAHWRKKFVKHFGEDKAKSLENW